MAEVAFREYLNDIDDLIEHGSLDQATQHCRHILAQLPKAVEVYRLLGKVLLEQEEDRAAQDVFQRVLSVDPEDFVARVGLSIVHDRNNELEPAIWHMERAFEIAPSNSLIQGELRRLYARRDGDSPERIPLTRGALARMYAAGDLNAEAIVDLRQLLAEQTERLDLQVQLAEVLWRDEQRVEAAERTLQITTLLPYCLKANLILGAILRASGANGESDEPLLRAQAVDPENEYAQRLFSGLGPLYQQSVMVDHLELQTVDQMLAAPLPTAEAEEIPDWLRGLSDLEQPLLEEPDSMHAARLGPGLHMPDDAAQVPDWLQGLSGETGAAAEAEVPGWLAALTGAAVAGAAVEAAADRRAEPEAAVIKPSEEEAVPDWIAQLGQTGTLTPTEETPRQEEDEPAWMTQLREQPPAPFSEQVSPTVDTVTPDWLAQLQASEATPDSEAAGDEGSDWLAQLRTSSGEVETSTDEGFDLGIGKAAAGLAGLVAAGAALAAASDSGEEAAEVEPESPIDYAAPADTSSAEIEQPLSFAVTAAAPEPQIPEEMPSADDALAFLAKLAAGKEDQLRAQAEQDAETRMAEIMGRKPEVKPAREEESGTGLAAGVALGAAAVAGIAATKKDEPVAPSVAEAPAVVPEEMPSADDALAFLAKLAAGKEDQLRAQAEQDAETRMAEIMGRKPTEAAPTVEEKAPIKMTVPAATVAAVAAGLAAMSTKPEEKPAEPQAAAVVPEEMPSADDALAFLSRLAAGKEDQLRAQAEQEAEVRMAAIMGRSAPAGPAKPIETAPTPAVVIEPEAEIAEPAAEADLPDWLKAMRPTEEAVAETPEAELPEWLRAMRPTEESPEAGLAALIEEEAPIEATPADELPDWPRASQPVEAAVEEPAAEMEAEMGVLAAVVAAADLSAVTADASSSEVMEEPSAEDLLAELAALEQSAAQVGVFSPELLPAPLQTSALLPFDWWIQAAADTGEPALAELPELYLTPRARAAEKEKAVAAQVPAAEAKPAAERRLPQTGPLSLPQTSPLSTPAPAPVSTEVEALLSRVFQDEQDHAARLDLARTYWATGNREGAYTEYLALVNAGEYTKETMADLETIVEVHDQTDWHRMLGDVYMKAGRLSSALEQYRRALSEV
jgi:tetratricopeptide (TPR) repeat protein